MTHRPPVIGLVGGIASGKSTVAAMLRELGCVVCDADRTAQEALDDSGVQQELVRWWGDRTLDDAGKVDRAVVADIVFANDDDRRRLERLIHPLVEQARHACFSSAPPDTKALIIDAPLLLEAGLGEQCDAILHVESSLPRRQERVHAARGWDKAELARREETQVSLDEKRSRADHVLCNDGDETSLKAEVTAALEAVLRTALDPPDIV